MRSHVNPGVFEADHVSGNPWVYKSADRDDARKAPRAHSAPKRRPKTASDGMKPTSGKTKYQLAVESERKKAPSVKEAQASPRRFGWAVQGKHTRRSYMQNVTMLEVYLP
jgi:hypothetical protein